MCVYIYIYIYIYTNTYNMILYYAHGEIEIRDILQPPSPRLLCDISQHPVYIYIYIYICIYVYV